MSIEGKLVCVTGASGYVGSHVVSTLLKRGCKVRATVRDTSDEAKVSHLGAMGDVELVAADLLDPDSFENVSDDCDFVIHTASTVKLRAKDPQREIVDVAVGATRNVLSAVAPTVERVVVTSSIAAIVDEDAPADRTFTEADWNKSATLERDPYFLSKILAEKEAIHLGKTRPFDLVVINPAYVLGPVLAKPHLRSSPSMVRIMLRGKIPACPRIALNMVDVRDVAEAHVRALEIDEPAERYICANAPVWMAQMGRTIKRTFSDHPVPTRQLPDLLAYATIFVNKQVSFGFLKRNLGVQRQLDNSRIVSDMDLKFTDLDDTLVDTARSIIEGGWV